MAGIVAGHCFFLRPFCIGTQKKSQYGEKVVYLHYYTSLYIINNKLKVNIMKSNLKIFALAISVCTMFFFASCVKEYTITVQSNNDAYGTVTGSGTYAAGTQVTIVAIPAQGYYFNGWNDGNSDNPRTITVNATATYIATFSDQPGGGSDDDSDAITLEGSMDANRTLADRGAGIDYIIDGSFYVTGNACLTIEPGVTIAFTSVSGCIIVGENAGLKMVGTAQKPIAFRGPVNNNNVGSWGHIEYNSRRADNQMEYVDFINGGSDEDFGVITLENSAKVSMTHCTIDGSLGYGTCKHPSLLRQTRMAEELEGFLRQLMGW